MILAERDTIYDNKKYGWNSVKGFYKWAIFIADNSKVKNAKWLDDLKISKATIDKLLSPTGYFNSLLKRFNDELAFNLPDLCVKVCQEIDLMATQETDASIVNNIPGVSRKFSNIKELSEYVDTYNYDVSPEMKFYFQNEFSPKYPNVTYSDVKLSGEQFLKLFDTSKFIINLNIKI